MAWGCLCVNETTSFNLEPLTLVTSLISTAVLQSAMVSGAKKPWVTDVLSYHQDVQKY